MELQNLQTEKNQLDAKYKSTKKSINFWVILFLAGAVITALYGVADIALYFISAAIFILACGYLVEISHHPKMKELENKIKEKQNLGKNKPIPLILTLVLIFGIFWFYFYAT